MTAAVKEEPGTVATITRLCKKCGYKADVPWDMTAGESGQWQCPECQRSWPFLDFDHLWLDPGPKIEYAGGIEHWVPVSLELAQPRDQARVWRESSDDFGRKFLFSDPESACGSDFAWGLQRYLAERPPRFNLAFAILYHFYGWLSWADLEITDAPYRKRWAEHHAYAFLRQTIVELPAAKPWRIGDADMYSALRQIVPESFPLP